MPSKGESKKRVADLAQSLGLSNSALLSLLGELGFKLKSPMSPVTKEMEEAVRRKFEATRKNQRERIRRKKQIWGESKKAKGHIRKSFQDKTKIRERVKETLANLERGPARPKRKKVYHEPPPKVEEAKEKRKKTLKIPGVLSLGELAKMMGKEPAEVVAKALSHGIIATINQTLDIETTMILADEFGYEIEVMAQELIEEEIPLSEEELEPRPPIVTVMGHVDHGKTTLLDYLRKTNVAESEAGNITQHIGAYQVQHHRYTITFIDTPGHEAFTALRARGALVTDIVVLVVAATEGVKPQTIEAINHARAAGVPIIVALNKMDLPDADPEKCKRELAEQGLIPEEWGGKTITVEISAKTGKGVPDLLDAILLVAEELDLRTSYKGRAKGVILESRLERGRGPVATVIVQQGTLKVGDAIVAGAVPGKVRAMYDEWGKRLSSATPSMPALIQGLDEVPKAGDIFYVVESEKEARTIAEEKKELQKEQMGRGATASALTKIQEKLKKGQLKELPVVLKADCQGSLEAIADVLSQMVYEEVKTEIIHRGIGSVTESDVLLASASEGIVIAFGVGIEPSAKTAAKAEGVLIKRYRVIYELIDSVKEMLRGLLEPEIKEILLGKAEVREVFKVPRVGNVAGCYVLEGIILRDSMVRVRRDGEVIFTGKLASLKRFKEDVKEVKAGFECGIKVEGFEKIQKGDILEAFQVEKTKKELK